MKNKYYWLFDRARRTDSSRASVSTSRQSCGAVNGLSQTSSADPRSSTQRRPPGTQSRKSVSADCVESKEVTGSGGQEVNVRLVSSEHSTLGGRMTSSRRASKRSSRYYPGTSRRRPAASSKPRHVTESPPVTSSLTSSRSLRESQESPAVTSSSGNPPGPSAVTSSVLPREPRGRTSCKHSYHYHNGTGPPALTSSGTPRESPRGVREPRTPGRDEYLFLQASSRKVETSKGSDHGSCVRSSSVPPSSTMPSNPFSPFWNFFFKDRRTSNRKEDDDDEDHVCNTVRSPRNSWFGMSVVVTNVYQSTVNRWIGVWPTAASHLAVRGREIQAIDSGGQETNSRCTTPSIESQCPIASRTADTRQVGTS